MKEFFYTWLKGIKLIGKMFLVFFLIIIFLLFPAILSELFVSNWFYLMYILHFVFLLPLVAGATEKNHYDPYL